MNTHTVSGFHTSAASRIHTSGPVQDLMEFFDHKDVWGESSVASGVKYSFISVQSKTYLFCLGKECFFISF